MTDRSDRATRPEGTRSIEAIQDDFRSRDYIADRSVATAVFLALELGRPLLLEGEAGVGKTELAKVLAASLDTRLIRLQCYEGLDVNTAVYEWNYPRQMLEIRLLEARGAAEHATAGAVFVSATKGLEVDTLLRMSEVIAQEVGRARPVVVISGPTFAVEVARQLPTAILAASSDAAATELVQAEFRGPYFRLYGSDDVVGVELGGAMKNIIAIAAGVVEGLGLGHNALAALITRGLAELSRLACAAGGRRDTLAGLSGLGDLVLTCTGDLSRNRRVGLELAHGRSLPEILAATRMVAEGVRTTGAALALGKRYGVELPITTQMAEVLAGRADVRSAISALMVRPQRAEAETG
jgi:glycerol-3-phosphate dehydrogenase (NAD(P)+)